MEQETIIQAIETRAKAAGVSMAQVCDAAGVARSTFSRWKRSEGNPNPIGATLGSLTKLERALLAMEQSQAA